MDDSLRINKVTSLLVLFALGFLIFQASENAFGEIGATVETVRTIPGQTEGTYELVVKICAGENYRLEQPNIIISSDSEIRREHVLVHLPPGFCSHHIFTVTAKDPNSITVKIIQTTGFN